MTQHYAFGQNDSGFKVALLVKDVIFEPTELRKHYVDQFTEMGGKPEDVLALSLDGGNKPNASQIKSTLKQIVTVMKHLGITHVLLTDASYFSKFTGEGSTKARKRVLPCIKSSDFDTEEGDFQVVFAPNYKQVFFDDRVPEVISESLQTLVDVLANSWEEPGKGIIHHEEYHTTVAGAVDLFDRIDSSPRLSIDIEAYSLRHDKAGIATIGFAWSQHEGAVIAVDCQEEIYEEDGITLYHKKIDNRAMKIVLKEFLLSYKGQLIAQGGYGYDLKILIYELFMESPSDIKGMLKGLKCFYFDKEYDDTRLIAYLATNSTAGNVLGLKPLSAEFTGNYAEDVTDIRTIPIKDLLKYNLIDCLATLYVYDKYFPIVVADNQLVPYNAVLKPSMPTITQAELVGMPMCMDTVKTTEKQLEEVRADSIALIQNHPELIKFRDVLAQRELDKDFTFRRDKAKNPDKIKPKTIDQFDDVEFNPGSGQQLGILLHEYFGLPVFDKTKTGLPATGGDSLTKLRNHLVVEYGITEEDLS